VVRVCLVSAATVTDFGKHAEDKRISDAAKDPPLGVLTLAAILREQLITPAVVDLNRVYYDYLADSCSQSEADFCAYAVSRIPPDFDVIGFSTICSSYPLTIRIAERFRKTHPGTGIIFGGPQASAVDVATLDAFPFVDLIVRGEADETLVKVLRTGLRSPALAFVSGITFRGRGSIVRNPEAPLVDNLDALPFPAFDLLPGMDAVSSLSLELGRGCPYACTFCSTSDFFRRRFRLKSPEVVLAQMRKARREYGASRFDLVHDMFTVDRKRVVAFCQTLLDSGEQFHWGCSARTDCIDDELISLMHHAGCRSVFFGVETGSPRLQRAIRKDLDLNDAAARIQSCAIAGMETTASLIVGFPEETEEDLWQTVGFLLDAARYERVEAQLHIVAPLAGTPLYNRFRGKLVSDGVHSDTSYQGWKQDEEDKGLIAAFPDVFPNFYGVPVVARDRRRLKRLRDFILYGLRWFRAVMVALHQSRGGIRGVFEAWEEAYPALTIGGEERGSYYASVSFWRDFAQFVRSRYLWGSESDGSLAALLQFEHEVLEHRGDGRATVIRRRVTKKSSAAIIPVPRLDVRLLDCDVDIRAILDHLRRGDGLPPPSRRPVTLATRERSPVGTDIMELTPLSASFLKLCDGRTLDGVAAELQFDSELESIGRDQICTLTFQELCKQRLVTW
jgi:radical SAM superfamily enzyme YgiQ (UPF0313 family)